MSKLLRISERSAPSSKQILILYTGVTAHAYLRWLRTQGLSSTRTVNFDGETSGWLYSQLGLHSQRAPGHTCLSALQEMQHPGEPAQNNSKGCGGVMRVAPVGLFGRRLGQCASPEQTFELGTELAALTHGHPTGALTGGVLAVLILQLTNGATLTEALRMATAILRQRPHHEETLRALEQAQALSASDTAPEQAITRLGEGWIAEEALAIAVYCALVANDFRHGVILAVNHDGDSDSTGAIAGNLLGTLHGVRAIPQEWLSPLELHDVIQELASDLHAFRSWDIGEHSQDKALLNRILQKYPWVLMSRISQTVLGQEPRRASIQGHGAGTAMRHLSDLLSKGCIVRLPGGGLSTRYVIVPASTVSST